MKKSALKVVIVMLFTLFLSVLLEYLINRDGQGFNSLIDDYISLTALVVSVIALVMALLTYFSIDSVNTKSTMEGNVLENDAYSISMVSMINQYKKEENDNDILKRVFKKQHRVLRKRSLTNIEVADALQMLIDDYAIIGNCNMNSKLFSRKAKKSLRLMERRIAKLRDYSNGLQHVVEENCKMIRYLYSRNFSRSALDEIRGDLFINPYTRYLYYDSIGRQYYWEIVPRAITLFGYGFLTMEDFRQSKRIFSDSRKYIMKLKIEKSMEAMERANSIPIYNKPYTVYINDFIFRLNMLKKIYFGEGDVEQSFLKNRDAWISFKEQAGIDFYNMNGSYLLTAIFKSYFRTFLAYHAYCAVYSKLPETWLYEMNELLYIYNLENNCAASEKLLNLEPSIKEYPEMLELFFNTYAGI